MEILTVEEFARLYEGPELSPKAFEVIVYIYNGIKVSIKAKQKIAHELVTKAIIRGDLIRPVVCEECEGISPSLHAHHEDYYKPLEVEWLCNSCHSKRRDYIDMAAFELWEILGEILTKSLYMEKVK